MSNTKELSTVELGALYYLEYIVLSVNTRTKNPASIQSFERKTRHRHKQKQLFLKSIPCHKWKDNRLSDRLLQHEDHNLSSVVLYCTAVCRALLVVYLLHGIASVLHGISQRSTIRRWSKTGSKYISVVSYGARRNPSIHPHLCVL